MEWRERETLTSVRVSARRVAVVVAAVVTVVATVAVAVRLRLGQHVSRALSLSTILFHPSFRLISSRLASPRRSINGGPDTSHPEWKYVSSTGPRPHQPSLSSTNPVTRPTSQSSNRSGQRSAEAAPRLVVERLQAWASTTSAIASEGPRPRQTRGQDHRWGEA